MADQYTKTASILMMAIKLKEDLEDGVKKRASVPSWDEIMFGTKKESDGSEPSE